MRCASLSSAARAAAAGSIFVATSRAAAAASGSAFGPSRPSMTWRPCYCTGPHQCDQSYWTRDHTHHPPLHKRALVTHAGASLVARSRRSRLEVHLVLLAALLLELALLLGGGVLVLLVLGHEVVHVRLGLRGSRRRKQRDGEQRRGKRSKGEAGSGRKRAALRTSVNSISSMPSPVYQWRKALRRNIEVNCEERKSANELANALAGEALAGEKEP